MYNFTLYVYICMIYIYVCICIYVYIYNCICNYIHVHFIYLDISVYIYRYICVHMYTSIHVAPGNGADDSSDSAQTTEKTSRGGAASDLHQRKLIRRLLSHFRRIQFDQYEVFRSGRKINLPWKTFPTV